MILLAYLQSEGNETPERTSIYFKNERKLCVYNICLCDENKFRKISENKLHQTSKWKHKWKYPQSRGNETPKKISISYKMRESCVYVENIILCAWKIIYKTKALCVGTSQSVKFIKHLSWIHLSSWKIQMRTLDVAIEKIYNCIFYSFMVINHNVKLL